MACVEITSRFVKFVSLHVDVGEDVNANVDDDAVAALDVDTYA